jgi:hypothetical protein
VSVLTYSVALFVIGIIIALAFHEDVGAALSVTAVVGILYGLISFETERSRHTGPDDGSVDDVVRHPRA